MDSDSDHSLDSYGSGDEEGDVYDLDAEGAFDVTGAGAGAGADDTEDALEALDTHTRLILLMREAEADGDTAPLHGFIGDDADRALLALRLAAEAGRVTVAHELLDRDCWRDAIRAAPSDFLWIAACLGGDPGLMERLMELLPRVDPDLTLTTLVSTRHVDTLFWMWSRDPAFKTQALADMETYLAIADDADIIGALTHLQRSTTA